MTDSIASVMSNFDRILRCPIVSAFAITHVKRALNQVSNIVGLAIPSDPHFLIQLHGPRCPVNGKTAKEHPGLI
jgi:hypothetical protein